MVISNETIVGLDRTHTLIIIDVPMFDGTPWKIKAEQVMRFIDVEAGLGDQTAYDLMYYRQPFDRKVRLYKMPFYFRIEFDFPKEDTLKTSHPLPYNMLSNIVYNSCYIEIISSHIVIL